MANPYASPKTDAPLASPRLHHILTCVAFFCFGLGLPLSALTLFAFSTHPRGPHDLSVFLEIADDLLVPFGLFAICAIAFGVYAIGRTRCQRILVSRLPSFLAGLLFPFVVWFIGLLDYAFTGRPDLDFLKLPAMILTSVVFSEIAIIRRYFGCGLTRTNDHPMQSSGEVKRFEVEDKPSPPADR